MSGYAPAPRPGSVTFVVVLTWIVAIVAVAAGVMLLLLGEDTLADLDVSSATASTYGWAEIVWGAVVALVAIGVGNGNNFSRFLVTVLMVLRLVAAVVAVVALQGTAAFWSGVVTAGVAIIILIMLWNARASAFFRTN